MKVKTWDAHNINDGTNYVSVVTADAYGLPEVGVRMAPREGRWPLTTGLERDGRELILDISVTGSSPTTLQGQLYQWFDPEDETPKKLIVEDEAGGADRYVYAVCRRLHTISTAYGFHYLARLVVHGDVRWREVTASTDSWAITASGQTKVVANAGDDDAYPVLQIKPTGGKTSGNGLVYRSFVTVDWKVNEPFTGYPVDIGNDAYDTDALVTAGKMQADGDDLRVYVDGLEVNRWLDGINTTTTKVWINLDFQARAETTLDVAMTDVQTSQLYVANGSGFAYSGILKIGTELIRYNYHIGSVFYQLTRGAYGTTAAAHSASDAVVWIQHEVYIYYGNASAAAPTVDDDYKPMFELASSTNTSWDFDAFTGGEEAYLRSAKWAYVLQYGTVSYYGGNRGVYADPYVELGINVEGHPYITGVGRFGFYNPCGITNANFANGEKYGGQVAVWDARIRSVGSISGAAWITEDTIAAPSAASTWESWSDDQALDTGSKAVELYLEIDEGAGINGLEHYLEAADCTLTLNSTYTPGITIGAEAGSYSLTATITNNTTGKALQVAFEMDLSQELEIDTYDKLVTYLKDNSNQFQALTLVGPARRDWLALQPGNNTLQFDDTGTQGVTIDLEWEERSYD